MRASATPPAVLSDVTVAVVVKDRQAAMARCLAAVRALDPAPGAVVVIDNGSTDGTWEALCAAAGDGLTVQRVPGTLGRARNAALAAVGTTWLASTDSDCQPRTDWLAHLHTGVGPKVGLVQGRTVPDPAADRTPWDTTQDISQPSGLFEACNLLLRVAPLRAAGGFDEAIGFFGEDTAGGCRLVASGWQWRWAQDAVVEHDVSPAGWRWHARRRQLYVRWPMLVRDHPELRQLLWFGVFLRRDQAELVAALAGTSLALAGFRPAGLAVLPYARRHRPRTLQPAVLRSTAGVVALDLLTLAALARGSLRARRMVL